MNISTAVKLRACLTFKCLLLDFLPFVLAQLREAGGLEPHVMHLEIKLSYFHQLSSAHTVQESYVYQVWENIIILLKNYAPMNTEQRHHKSGLITRIKPEANIDQYAIAKNRFNGFL